MRKKKLPRAFYAQPTVEVAKQLLGKYLVHHTEKGPRLGRIVETEAYVGPEDRASHASRGKTKRTAIMFGPPGFAYVYVIYGMYHCLNVVTEREGYPAAVLIRAVEPVLSDDEQQLGKSDPSIFRLANGPGKLCRYMGIDRSLNGADLCGSELYIEDWGESVHPEDIVATTRIGVEYAGEWKQKPWRFYVKGNPCVSKP
ncbi:MAG: DNA-3-methyladenine glycosylase [Acidobacteria bacterium]|nr:MAG: DNA-3-methyladenine glycosylase [Acidobacteriota bacterium]